MKLNWEWWFEWTSTILLIIGVALTSFDIYPLNTYFSLLANIGWLVVAIIWKKWSLGIVQLVVSALYVAGIVHHFMK